MNDGFCVLTFPCGCVREIKHHKVFGQKCCGKRPTLLEVHGVELNESEINWQKNILHPNLGIMRVNGKEVWRGSAANNEVV